MCSPKICVIVWGPLIAVFCNVGLEELSCCVIPCFASLHSRYTAEMYTSKEKAWCFIALCLVATSELKHWKSTFSFRVLPVCSRIASWSCEISSPKFPLHTNATRARVAYLCNRIGAESRVNQILPFYPKPGQAQLCLV